MNNKIDNKAIEEMAKICTDKCRVCHNAECRKTTKSQYCIVETLYNEGYRKVGEEEKMKFYKEAYEQGRFDANAEIAVGEKVVISKEEYENLQIAKDFDYGYHEGEKNMTAYYENIKLPETRKETAEDIRCRGGVMTFEQLYEILDNPSKKLTKTELCQVLFELKQYCMNEWHRVSDQYDMSKYQYYKGFVNAFNICLDLLEHLEVE